MSVHTAIQTRDVHGIVTEVCDRIYEVSPTPHYATHRPPFTLQCWGTGFWCRADGQRSHFPTEEAAHEAGRRWVLTGRSTTAARG